MDFCPIPSCCDKAVPNPYDLIHNKNKYFVQNGAVQFFSTSYKVKQVSNRFRMASSNHDGSFKNVDLMEATSDETKQDSLGNTDDSTGSRNKLKAISTEKGM